MQSPSTTKFDLRKLLMVLAATAALTQTGAQAQTRGSIAQTTSPTTTVTKTTVSPQQTDTPAAPAAPAAPQALSVPATNRMDAIMRARLGAGRVNPFAQSASTNPLLESAGLGKLKPLPKVHLPPPPTTDSRLAPPPPPSEVIMPGLAAQSVGQAGHLPQAGQLAGDSELPDPPEKPMLSEKMKLVGVLADKAFFTFTDLGLRRANKFPSTVVLANGEQFESVHLISVASNKVVLEEDGERFTKELERIR